MPAVGQIEGFVDQRKIRHDVLDNGMLDDRPVLPRRIVRMTAPDHSAGAGFKRKKYRSAPAFDHSDTPCALLRWRNFRAMRTGRHFPQYPLQEAGRLGEFI